MKVVAKTIEIYVPKTLYLSSEHVLLKQKLFCLPRKTNGSGEKWAVWHLELSTACLLLASTTKLQSQSTVGSCLLSYLLIFCILILHCGLRSSQFAFSMVTIKSGITRISVIKVNINLGGDSGHTRWIIFAPQQSSGTVPLTQHVLCMRATHELTIWRTTELVLNFSLPWKATAAATIPKKRVYI